MVIPFYGSSEPETFRLERLAMDRPGRVIAALDELLPAAGRVLDVGAGDGFTAERLTTGTRNVVALEPSAGMVDMSKRLPWVQGIAQSLPFRDRSFDGAYSTWAYFFPGLQDISTGLAEVDRVTRGPTAVVDNAGDDEFTSMSEHDIAIDPGFWRDKGFEIEIVETVFEFETLEDSRRLLEFYFGEGARPALRIQHRVALMVRPAGGG